MQFITRQRKAGNVADESRRGERVGERQEQRIGRVAVARLCQRKREDIGQTGSDSVLDHAAVENSVAAADDHLVASKRPPGKTEARCEIAVARVYQRSR